MSVQAYAILTNPFLPRAYDLLSSAICLDVQRIGEPFFVHEPNIRFG
jgi:hypothetical protein